MNLLTQRGVLLHFSKELVQDVLLGLGVVKCLGHFGQGRYGPRRLGFSHAGPLLARLVPNCPK